MHKYKEKAQHRFTKKNREIVEETTNEQQFFFVFNINIDFGSDDVTRQIPRKVRKSSNLVNCMMFQEKKK